MTQELAEMKVIFFYFSLSLSETDLHQPVHSIPGVKTKLGIV